MPATGTRGGCARTPGSCAWADQSSFRPSWRITAPQRALSDATTALIGELGMGGGRFEIAIDPLDADRPDPAGGERVQSSRIRNLDEAQTLQADQRTAEHQPDE